MYQPSCLLPCCQGKPGELAKKKLLSKPQKQFILSLGIVVSAYLGTLLANVESQPYCVPLLRSSRPMTYQMQANQCATITNAQSISKSSAKEFSRNLNVTHGHDFNTTS